ncbi:DDE_3 domain-containing protein [Trichonephila clavipes]|nr:DDE_3 domain-containing protein [Trichonephila clavipes]
MTGHIYRDVILEQHVRLFWGAMGAEFLFMDGKARPHRANIVYECLQSEDITRMDWPAYSPDLNPIEHVWDMLGRRIAARQPPPTYLLELWRIVRVQLRGGFVCHRSRVSSKHLSSHLPVDGVRFLGGQKGVALQLQDARVGVGSNKDADRF